MKTQQKSIGSFSKGEKILFEERIIEVTERGSTTGIGYMKGKTIDGKEEKMFYHQFAGDSQKLFEQIISE